LAILLHSAEMSITEVNWKCSGSLSPHLPKKNTEYHLEGQSIKWNCQGKRDTICWKLQLGKDDYVGLVMCNIWKTLEMQNGHSAGFVMRKKTEVIHALLRKRLSAETLSWRTWHGNTSVSRHLKEKNGKYGLLNVLVTGWTEVWRLSAVFFYLTWTGTAQPISVKFSRSGHPSY